MRNQQNNLEMCNLVSDCYQEACIKNEFLKLYFDIHV